MDTLIKKLTAANEAYRNGGALLMTDEEYDAALETLAKKVPNHPLLTTLRAAPVAGKTVPMPYYLGSLDKAKVPEDLAKWQKKQGAGGFNVSEKLDGISGLWNPVRGRLYLSGDENMGVDVSAWLAYVKTTRGDPDFSDLTEDVWIRGELILPKSAIPEGRLGRSIANGIFHRDTPDPVESAKVRFVSYEIIGFGGDLTVAQQMAWLATWGCWVPWNQAFKDLPTADRLTALLGERRAASEYDMDGLVVRTNRPILPRITKGNPKDAVAWKPPTGDTRLTKVIAVEWNASAQGRLVPRVQIEPVAIGGSTIQYVTGTHARRVVDWGVGPGAMVVIRKGGDVIPVLERVEMPATVAMPPAGTWEWEGDAATAINIKQVGQDSATVVAQLVRLATKLDWDSIGPSQMEKVVEAGYTTVPALRKVSLTDLKKLLGPTKGEVFHRTIQKDGWAKATEIDLYVASPVAKAGIGKTRLEVLLDIVPDVTTWTRGGLAVAPKGWSADSLREFLENWKAYETFRKTEWNFLPFPVGPSPAVTPATATPTPTIPQKGSVVFSGVRNADLEAKLLARGYKTVDTVKAGCVAVFIADDKTAETYTSGKTDKVKRIPGCKILRCAEWEAL